MSIWNERLQLADPLYIYEGFLFLDKFMGLHDGTRTGSFPYSMKTLLILLIDY